MKAFVLRKYGAPLRQVDMPEPVLGDQEVLVRMKAAGVNHGGIFQYWEQFIEAMLEHHSLAHH